MSFYGNIFYQLTNAFGKIFVKNSGNKKEQFLTSLSKEETLSAVGLDSSCSFDTGNSWINLKADKEDGSCTIYHAPIDSSLSSNTLVLFSQDNNNNATQLMPGDCIAIPTLSYDKAGHLLGKSTTNYFKLPILEVETNIEELQDTMDSVLIKDIDQDARLDLVESRCTDLEEQNNYTGAKSNFTTESSSDTITSVIGYIPTLRSNYGDKSNSSLQLTTAILDLDDRTETLENKIPLLGDREDLTSVEDMTVTKAIGKIDDLKETDSDYTDIVSSIQALHNATTDVAVSYHYLVRTVSDLEKRIGALEEKS